MHEKVSGKIRCQVQLAKVIVPILWYRKTWLGFAEASLCVYFFIFVAKLGIPIQLLRHRVT